MNLTAIRSDSRYLVFGDSTNTAYSDADILRNSNRAYHELTQIAMAACGTWNVRETIAQDDVIANVTKYALPADILTIKRVEIQPTSSTTALLAKKLDNRQIEKPLSEFEPDVVYYDLRKNYIQFYYNATFENVTNGLTLHLSNEITELSAVTDEPDYPEFTHRFITLSNAIDYCGANEMWSKRDRYKQDKKELVEAIEKHYANREQDEATKAEPKEVDSLYY